MILFPSAMSSSVNHSLAATGDTLRLTTAPCSATWAAWFSLRFLRAESSIWETHREDATASGSFSGRRGPNVARPMIPLLPAVLIRTSTRRWKSRKSPRSVYRWFRPTPVPVKTPFSTRQSPGWLGCVFQPVRSRPLKEWEKFRRRRGVSFFATRSVGAQAPGCRVQPVALRRRSESRDWPTDRSV